jgi:hypothetical protein
MTQPGQHPDAPRRGLEPLAVTGPDGVPGPGRAPARLRSAFLALIATAAASALLGVLTGFLWSAVAPRALLVAAGHGVAYVVNAETGAFIVADAWFCLLTAAAGLVCGVVGYLLAVGQQQGLASFRSALAASAPGVRLREPLTLGGHGALAFWPLLVGLVVGSIEVIGQSIERRRTEAAALAAPQPARPQ